MIQIPYPIASKLDIFLNHGLAHTDWKLRRSPHIRAMKSLDLDSAVFCIRNTKNTTYIFPEVDLLPRPRNSGNQEITSSPVT